MSGITASADGTISAGGSGGWHKVSAVTDIPETASLVAFELDLNGFSNVWSVPFVFTPGEYVQQLSGTLCSSFVDVFFHYCIELFRTYARVNYVQFKLSGNTHTVTEGYQKGAYTSIAYFSA